ncbi:MAG TPA: hypothetical protein DHW82_06215 [Spirochaetia bacterium]|nr:MAG: hypothetical protein A2Y41_01295 [Spirochaetes bacterium GWB1_36_13]HCL56587.1 hypothetical protein [Spirochaetia bacterium]
MMNQDWKKLLEESRNNYLSIVQSLSKMQKEIEKVMMYTAENNMAYQNELSSLLNNWVNIGNNIRDGLQNLFEENLKNTFNSIYFKLPFKDELDKLYGNIQESFQKYFDNIQNFNLLNKKK